MILSVKNVIFADKGAKGGSSMHRNLLKRLLSWKENPRRKPLLLRGVRQVGKTYLLQHFGRQHFQNYHYFNFEENNDLCTIFDRNLNPERILNELQYHAGQPIHSNDLIILDEIQECPRALTSLKYFQENRPDLAICSAGSLLGVHLNSGSFPVGKVEIVDMYPMSFFEFLGASGENVALDFLQQWKPGVSIPYTLHLRLWDQLKWYFIVGGLPEVVSTFLDQRENTFIAFQEVRKKQEQLITSYLADISKHSGKVNAMHVERMLRSVSRQLSTHEDGAAKRFRFKGVVPKVDRYNRLASAIDWLEAARLIIKVHITNSAQIPFLAFTSENRFKLLLFDVGILGAMSELPFKSILDYDFGTYKGYFAENFVAQEMLCSGHTSLYCWEEGRSEIEFLAEKEGKSIPVEVKSGRVTKAKSLAKFRQKYDPPLSVILSAKEVDIKGNIFYLPLYLAGTIPHSL